MLHLGQMVTGANAMFWWWVVGIVAIGALIWWWAASSRPATPAPDRNRARKDTGTHDEPERDQKD